MDSILDDIISATPVTSTMTEDEQVSNDKEAAIADRLTMGKDKVYMFPIDLYK